MQVQCRQEKILFSATSAGLHEKKYVPRFTSYVTDYIQALCKGHFVGREILLKVVSASPALRPVQG